MEDRDIVLWRRRAHLSTTIASVSFGMYIVVSYSAIQALLRQRRAGAKNRVLLAYACIMAAITWLWFIVGAIWSQRNLAAEDPDNPNQYDTLQCTPLGIVKDELAVLMVLGSDALLLHRTYVIWDGYRPVLIIPCLMYAAIFVLGNALTLICAAVPAGEALDPILAMRIGIPFWLLSIVLNILTTLIVAYRLLAHRRALLQLGVLPHDAARFASVVGILSESAGLYSAAGLIYLPHFVLNTSWSGPLSSLFAGMSYLCPAWIVLRCARGDAYERAPSLASSRTKSVDIDSIAFAPNAELNRRRNSGDSTLGDEFFASHRGAPPSDDGASDRGGNDAADDGGFRMTFAQKPQRRHVDWADEEEREVQRSIRGRRVGRRESGDSAEREPLWDGRSDRSSGSYSTFETPHRPQD